MEVAGNAVGIDLGKRTYEMCIISRTDREEILPLLKGCEKDEAGRLAERLDLIEKQIGELYKKINEDATPKFNIRGKNDTGRTKIIFDKGTSQRRKWKRGF